MWKHNHDSLLQKLPFSEASCWHYLSHLFPEQLVVFMKEHNTFQTWPLLIPHSSCHLQHLNRISMLGYPFCCYWKSKTNKVYEMLIVKYYWKSQIYHFILKSGLFVCQPNAKLALATFTIKTHVQPKVICTGKKKCVYMLDLIFLYVCLSNVKKKTF